MEMISFFTLISWLLQLAATGSLQKRPSNLQFLKLQTGAATHCSRARRLGQKSLIPQDGGGAYPLHQELRDKPKVDQHQQLHINGHCAGAGLRTVQQQYLAANPIHSTGRPLHIRLRAVRPSPSKQMHRCCPTSRMAACTQLELLLDRALCLL
jgi:hypothetical protein